MGLDLLAQARLHPIESEADDIALPTRASNEITEWPPIHHSRGRDRPGRNYPHDQPPSIPSC